MDKEEDVFRFMSSHRLFQDVGHSRQITNLKSLFPQSARHPTGGGSSLRKGFDEIGLCRGSGFLPILTLNLSRPDISLGSVLGSSFLCSTAWQGALAEGGRGKAVPQNPRKTGWGKKFLHPFLMVLFIAQG